LPKGPFSKSILVCSTYVLVVPRVELKMETDVMGIGEERCNFSKNLRNREICPKVFGETEKNIRDANGWQAVAERRGQRCTLFC
jgi:hypothetical protein